MYIVFLNWDFLLTSDDLVAVWTSFSHCKKGNKKTNLNIHTVFIVEWVDKYVLYISKVQGPDTELIL